MRLIQRHLIPKSVTFPLVRSPGSQGLVSDTHRKTKQPPSLMFLRGNENSLLKDFSMTPQVQSKPHPQGCCSWAFSKALQSISVMSYAIWDRNTWADRQISRAAFIWANCLLVKNRAQKDYNRGWGHWFPGVGGRVLDVQGTIRVTGVRSLKDGGRRAQGEKCQTSGLHFPAKHSSEVLWAPPAELWAS